MPSMDHLWMASHFAFPPLSKYPWMPELPCHPWTSHGWPATLPSPLCLSIHGCQSYRAIHGPSMDGQPPCLPPPSKYPWMAELLCRPWTIHGWPATFPSPFCLSIPGCKSYCAIHGPSMDDQSPCPYPLSMYPWMPELLCHPWTIRGWPATLPSPL